MIITGGRFETKAEYEFADGIKTEIVICALSAKESRDIAGLIKDDTKTGNDVFEMIARKYLCMNAHETVERIIDENVNGEGSILELTNALSKAVEETKKGK